MTIQSVMRIVPSLWCFLIVMMTLIPMIATDVAVVVTAYVVVESPVMYHHRHRHQVVVSQSRTRCYSNFDNDTNHETHNKNKGESPIDSVSDDHRRRILHRGILAGGTLVSTAATTFSPQPVNALLSSNNRLFQSNTLLTNPILEQLRIWEQEEADNIKYNGELERGDAGKKGQINAYPTILIPILTISQDISYLYQILVGSTHPTTTTTQPNYDRKESYERAQSILSNHTVYDTIPFKRTFNAYADNVYYSDPDRANLYLGGGGTCVLYVCHFVPYARGHRRMLL